MEITYENGSVILHKPKDFSLTHIFDCGQCFRFNKTGSNSYTGVAFGKAVTVSERGEDVVFHDTSEADFKNIWYDFFDLYRDYGKIKKTLAVDDVMKKAVECGRGIRILKQDLWETIVSFIISQSNNIPRIKGIIERFCQNFGTKTEYMGNVYYTFPDIKTTASLSLDDLSVIRAGFRDKYILNAAKLFDSGKMDIDALKAMSSKDAKSTLMSFKGIGNKVSDCIMLFGLGHTDSFPVDVWIKRIMEYCYFDGEQPIKTISDFAYDKFSPLCGYAQQYLFFYARENKIGI